LKALAICFKRKTRVIKPLDLLAFLLAVLAVYIAVLTLFGAGRWGSLGLAAALMAMALAAGSLLAKRHLAVSRLVP
jgi:hypothetical protein